MFSLSSMWNISISCMDRTCFYLLSEYFESAGAINTRSDWQLSSCSGWRGWRVFKSLKFGSFLLCLVNKYMLYSKNITRHIYDEVYLDKVSLSLIFILHDYFHNMYGVSNQVFIQMFHLWFHLLTLLLFISATNRFCSYKWTCFIWISLCSHVYILNHNLSHVYILKYSLNHHIQCFSKCQPAWDKWAEGSIIFF